METRASGSLPPHCKSGALSLFQFNVAESAHVDISMHRRDARRLSITNNVATSDLAFLVCKSLFFILIQSFLDLSSHRHQRHSFRRTRRLFSVKQPRVVSRLGVVGNARALCYCAAWIRALWLVGNFTKHSKVIVQSVSKSLFFQIDYNLVLHSPKSLDLIKYTANDGALADAVIATALHQNPPSSRKWQSARVLHVRLYKKKSSLSHFPFLYTGASWRRHTSDCCREQRARLYIASDV